MTEHPTPDRESPPNEPDYEPPSVEEIETQDSPAVTAAGVDITGDSQSSDLRLKRSLRPLKETLIRSR